MNLDAAFYKCKYQNPDHININQRVDTRTLNQEQSGQELALVTPAPRTVSEPCPTPAPAPELEMDFRRIRRLDTEEIALDLEQEAETRTGELLDQIITLKQCSAELSELIVEQQPAIDQVSDNIIEAETSVESGNTELTAVARGWGTGSSMKGVVTGLLTGMGVGGVAGLVAGAGVGTIPCLAVGGIGGGIVGYGGSRGMTGYINYRLRRVLATGDHPGSGVIMRLFYGDSSTESVRQGSNLICDAYAERQLTMSPPEIYSLQLAEANPDSGSLAPSRSPSLTPAQQNLIRALRELEATDQIMREGYRTLIDQTECFWGIASHIESLQQQLETAGVLAARLSSNSIMFFLKLSLMPEEQQLHIDRVVGSIQGDMTRQIQEQYPDTASSVTGFFKRLTSQNQPVDNYLVPARRHGKISFWSWQDVKIVDDFLLLQHDGRIPRRELNYRVVAVNPDDSESVLKLYYFGSFIEQGALETFERLVKIFRRMFHGMDLRDVYNILKYLPEINSHLEDHTYENLDDFLLKKMLQVLRNDITPHLLGVNNELEIQNMMLNTISGEVDRSRGKLKGVNHNLKLI